MFVKFINKYKVEQPPKHLYTTKEIEGEKHTFLVCSRTDAVMNQLGYYELIVDDYPTDTEYNYTPWYEKAGLAIHQHWERGDKIEPVDEATDPTTEFMETVSNPDTNSIAKIRAAARTFLENTGGVE